MVDREQTYITSIEKLLQVNATAHDGSGKPEIHDLNDYNFMFFVVKNYSNRH